MAVKPIIRDENFLRIPSVEATKADLSLGQDLKDTLMANRQRCVGMAANMIGVSKRVIIAMINGKATVMFNPVIVSKKDPYSTSEGCLSLDGERSTTRFRAIEVEYTNTLWLRKKGRFKNFEAQIIQHEIDHLNGIII